MWELIDGFNKLKSKIASGVQNTPDYLMSAIRFWNNPKGDPPHNLFIFRNPYPFGMELNNMVCYRLGAMLYLDIQK